MLALALMDGRKRTTPRARDLRRAETDAERRLWFLLRGRRFEGLKFRRQRAVGPFFVDFACSALRLAIELDGGGHTEPAQAERDLAKDSFLERTGWRVLRFWNHDVLFSTNVVLETIAAAASGYPSP